MIAPASTIGEILDEYTRHDPDDSKLSPSEVRALFSKDTVESLIERLRAARVIECGSNHHDDPGSQIRWNKCPYREISLTCGHPDRIRDSAIHEKVKTIGAAMTAACHVLIARGDKRGSIFLSQAHRHFSTLNRQDSAAQLAFVQLRGLGERVEESTRRDAALEHPIARSQTVGEVILRLSQGQQEIGAPMSALRDHIVEALLESEAACATIEA